MPWRLTWRPRNSTRVWNNSHFLGLNLRSNSRKRRKTSLRLSKWLWKSLPSTKASSRNASTMRQVRPLNTRLIAREKVAGALQSPNPIRTNSNRPYFVTKAVFCLSLGLIRI